jgi:VirE-like protein
LKCVFRVAAHVAEHKGSFRAIEKHVHELCGVQIDKSCSDVARLCFLSHDPAAYFNGKAVELPLLADAKVHKSAIAAASVRNPQIGRLRRIAGDLLGDIRWVSETRGFGTCPFLESHTTPDADRDLRVDVDGVPTIHCFHNSCRDKIAELNVTFRSRIQEEDAETILGETYFVDDKYWRKSGEAWRPITKQNFADDLRVTGFSARPSSKADRASDVLRLMNRIRAQRVLDAAVPIVHDSREIL